MQQLFQPGRILPPGHVSAGFPRQQQLPKDGRADVALAAAALPADEEPACPRLEVALRRLLQRPLEVVFHPKAVQRVLGNHVLPPAALHPGNGAADVHAPALEEFRFLLPVLHHQLHGFAPVAAQRAVVVVLLVQGALLPVVAFGFSPFQLPAGRFGVRGERHSALLLHPLQQLGQCCGCLLHVLAPFLPRFSPLPSSPSWDSCPPSSRWRCSSP